MTTKKRLRSVLNAHENSWRLSEEILEAGRELRTIFIPDEVFPFQGFKIDPLDEVLVTHFEIGGNKPPIEFPVAASRFACRSKYFIEVKPETSIVLAIKHTRLVSMPVVVWLYSARDKTDEVLFG